MANISLALRYGIAEGVTIYNPYLDLREKGGTPRGGQLTMVAAPPGGCKTAFITDWMLSQPGSVLYFSADGDRGTVGIRALAGVTGETTSVAEERIFSGDETAYAILAERTSHIDYCLESSLSPGVIEREVEAYGLIHGAWPEIIVVDNLIDVSSSGSGGMDDWSGMTETAIGLKNLASETGASVILLHHVTKTFVDGADPVPLSAILGGVDKPQRLILTIHRPAEDEIFVSIVKNSNGPAMTDGSYGSAIPVDLGRMYFGGK
jgi:hypothetical protein